jgi:hypothetical protein
MRTFTHLFLVLASVLLAAAADNPTALQLIPEGNRYVGEQAKDKVVQIRSEKSVGSLKPNIWYVVYYDPTATFKTVEVKFGGGKMMDVKRPFRVIETITSNDKELDKSKLKIDSDAAIESASKEPIFENLKLKSVQAKLQNSNSGPVWILRFWAAKLRNPNDMADLGEITLSAEDGKLIKNDIHPDRVD